MDIPHLQTYHDADKAFNRTANLHSQILRVSDLKVAMPCHTCYNYDQL